MITEQRSSLFHPVITCIQQGDIYIQIHDINITYIEGRRYLHGGSSFDVFRTGDLLC